MLEGLARLEQLAFYSGLFAGGFVFATKPAKLRGAAWLLLIPEFNLDDFADAPALKIKDRYGSLAVVFVAHPVQQFEETLLQLIIPRLLSFRLF